MFSQRPSAIQGARRSLSSGLRNRRCGRTITVVYDSAHLRVRVHEGDVQWFVRDIALALGFQHPLPAGDATPQVLVNTTQLWALMAHATFCPPQAFTAWATGLARTLPLQTTAASAHAQA
ncbi:MULTISPECIES: hypothetical protein [unclassified Streptomyces]|uniref:hypothetical protein n=1 Tax=Streptomyces TaxID=1883 RepID=UPI0037BD1E27